MKVKKEERPTEEEKNARKKKPEKQSRHPSCSGKQAEEIGTF